MTGLIFYTKRGYFLIVFFYSCPILAINPMRGCVYKHSIYMKKQPAPEELPKANICAVLGSNSRLVAWQSIDSHSAIRVVKFVCLLFLKDLNKQTIRSLGTILVTSIFIITKLRKTKMYNVRFSKCTT